MGDMQVSVLIPTMNRPESLKRTLDSYFAGSMCPDELVVVDQSDETQAKIVNQIVRDYMDKCSVKYIRQKTASLTKARNLALADARSEVLVCSDDDIEVYSDTLENVVNLMHDPKLAMIGGLNDNSLHSKSKVGYVLGTKSWKKRKIGHVTTSMLGRYPVEVVGMVPTEWAMGYFFVIRRSCCEKWDMNWDEHLVEYAYAEDLDFSFRYFKLAQANGFNCILSDKVHVKHLASMEYRIPSRKRTFMYICNRMYIANKLGELNNRRMAIYWCNLWQYIARLVHKENSKDFKDALCYLKKHKKEIYEGNLDFEEYC